MIENIFLISMVVIAIIMQLVDVRITNKCIELGAREKFFLSKFFMDKLGEKWYLGKLSVALAAITIIAIPYNNMVLLRAIVLAAVNAFYLKAVVINNFKVYKKLSGLSKKWWFKWLS